MAFAAEGIAYGMNVVYTGPLYGSMKTEVGAIRLQFKHLSGGLAAKGAAKAIKGFEIAGEDRKFVPAEAIVSGNEVIVGSALVRRPVAARYAWRDFPESSLYGRSGLPAVPFRTDDWPAAKPETK